MPFSTPFYSQQSGVGIICQDFTVPANDTLTTSILMDKFVKASIITVAAGGEAVPVGTIDPDSTSTGDAAVIDNNYSNLLYNNTSAGSAGKSLPAIDLGTPKEIDNIRVYWWNPNTYGSNNFNIEASNDGANWDVIASGLSTGGTTTGSFDDIAVSGTYQYWRFRNIVGKNATWVVISEIEASAVGVNQEILWNYTTDITVQGVAGDVTVANNTGADLDVHICYEG